MRHFAKQNCIRLIEEHTPPRNLLFSFGRSTGKVNPAA